MLVAASRDFYNRLPMARIHIFKRSAAALARVLPPTWRFRVCGVPDLQPTSAAAEGTPVDCQTLAHGTGSHIGGHLDAQDRMLWEGPREAAESLRQRYLLRQRFFPRVRQVSGTAWSLATSGANNYFHWMFECLPRLRFLREAAVPYDWVYACRKLPYQSEAFAHLGLPAEKIIDTAEVPYLRADQMVLPRRVHMSESWIIPWLREVLLPLGHKATGRERPRRVYISRRKASSRGVTNDAELLELLRARGFVEVRMEELALAEQIALFAQAEAIVAPHGAGLTNLVFSEPGQLVVELIAEGYNSTLYQDLARARQLNTHLVLCPAQDPTNVFAAAITVDITRVRTILDGALHGIGHKKSVAVEENG